MEIIHWTLKDIPNLEGKTIIVTGGNSGLGYEAVKALARKNATVIMACRSVSKGELAKKQILDITSKSHIVVMELDLADLNSIRSFVVKFKQNYAQLHVLLNNAGIMMVPYGLTKDGFEKQIGTNHLGHYALTGLLLDVLKVTPKSRVVNVSSIAHKQGLMDFDNLLYDKGIGYSPMKAYSRSKLSNLLFSYELQRFFEANNIDCVSVAAHPGVSDTNLFNHAANKWIMALLKPLFKFMVQPAAMGALPELRASVDATVKGGEYYGPDGKREMNGFPILVHSTPASHDKESARRLWDISQRLTNVVYK